MPRVSVIIPTYERRGFLDEALSSVVSQAFKCLVRVRMAPRRSIVGGLLMLERMAKRMRGWWAKRADADMTLSERSA